MSLKPLPTGLFTFRNIIEQGFLYVDKTRHLYPLIKHKLGVYFLARPRRFGKSLLISTLESIFQGERELFKGLWLEQADYGWETYPVLRLDFSTYSGANSLESYLRHTVDELALAHHVEVNPNLKYAESFQQLIVKLAKSKGAVVILIDEYDKPLLEVLDDSEAAKANFEPYLHQLADKLQQSYEQTVEAVRKRYIRVLFANLPYHLHIAEERYYQSVFYLLFTLVGISIHAEVATNIGRMDAIIENEETIFIFEFKFNDTAQAALQQIYDRKYYEPYLNQNKPIYLIGVQFEEKQKNVGNYLVEPLTLN